VGISGNLAIVGAPKANNNTGSVTVFDVYTWGTVCHIPGSTVGDNFGNAVSIG